MCAHARAHAPYIRAHITRGDHGARMSLLKHHRVVFSSRRVAAQQGSNVTYQLETYLLNVRTCTCTCTIYIRVCVRAGLSASTIEGFFLVPTNAHFNIATRQLTKVLSLLDFNCLSLVYFSEFLLLISSSLAAHQHQRGANLTAVARRAAHTSHLIEPRGHVRVVSACHTAAACAQGGLCAFVACLRAKGDGR